MPFVAPWTEDQVKNMSAEEWTVEQLKKMPFVGLWGKEQVKKMPFDGMRFPIRSQA